MRMIRAYWSKRRVVPQFFLELITTQLRFYMVSPQLVVLIILTMQSYKFYLSYTTFYGDHNHDDSRKFFRRVILK